MQRGQNRMALAFIWVRATSGTEKPQPLTAGQVGRAERNVEFSPSRSATSVGRLRAEHPLVALPTFWVLFIQKFARRSQGTKTFDLDQNFEPRARNRRLTRWEGGAEMSERRMSDEFDSRTGGKAIKGRI